MEGREGLQLGDLPTVVGRCCSLYQDLGKQTEKIFSPVMCETWSCGTTQIHVCNYPICVQIVNCSVTEVDTYLFI